MSYVQIVYNDNLQGRAAAALLSLHYDEAGQEYTLSPTLIGMPHPRPRHDPELRNCSVVFFLDLYCTAPTHKFLEERQVAYTTITKIHPTYRDFVNPSQSISEHYSTLSLIRGVFRITPKVPEVVEVLDAEFMRDDYRYISDYVLAVEDDHINHFRRILKDKAAFETAFERGKGIAYERSHRMNTWLKARAKEPMGFNLPSNVPLLAGVFEEQLFDSELYAKCYMQYYSVDCCITWMITPDLGVIISIYTNENLNAHEIASQLSLSPGGTPTKAAFTVGRKAGFEMIDNLLKGVLK